MLTRETGGTPIGERLREILHDTTVTDLADRAEALITAADRAQHVAHVVRPALAAGRPSSATAASTRRSGTRGTAAGSTSTCCAASTTGPSTASGRTA